MSAEKREETAATFTVSVAASLAGMHAQTLRQYDRLGLVIPARTKGKGRRYSHLDLERLRHIQRMTQEEGMNLAGVQRVLNLEDELDELRREIVRLTEVVRSSAAPTRGVFLADSTGRVRIRPHAMTQGKTVDSSEVAPETPNRANPAPAAAVTGALELSQKRGNMLVRQSLSGWQLLAALRVKQVVAERMREGQK